MSGHSKWANIRVKKTAQDARRGKIFTKYAKLIEIAAREGGGKDPTMNTKLATAIESARSENVPTANIERAIKKGTGELKEAMTEETLYAAFGPGGVAFLIECLTDNRNRTLASVRAIVERRGGRWAESSAVLHLFDRKGMVVAKSQAHSTGSGQVGSDQRLPEEVELQLIDAGAEDINALDDVVSVTTSAGDWPRARKVLEKARFCIESAGLKYIAKQDVSVNDLGTAKKMLEIIEAVEEDEDVSEVHTNAFVADAIARQLQSS